MAKIGRFIELANGQVNKGIYVWGAQGELLSSITPEWIRKKEDSTANANKAIAMYEKRKGISGARAFDCSGLVCWSLAECGAKDKGFDKTAEGLRQLCSKLSKPAEDGDLCFKISDGKAHHVGIYAGGKIIEAKGRAYGVVSSSVSSSWNAFGRLNIKWDEEPKAFILTRVLRKGDKGEDVRWVQNALLQRRYKLPKYGADGDFGTETLKAVKQFQRDKGLKDDGAVGEKTITALGGRWKK